MGLLGFRVREPGCGPQESAGRKLGTQRAVCVCVTASEPGRQPVLMKPGRRSMAPPPPQRGRHDPDASPSVFQSETLTRFCGAPTKPTNDADLLGLLWPWSYRASPTDLFLSLPDCSLLTQALRSQAPLLSHPLLASTLLCLHSFRH